MSFGGLPGHVLRVRGTGVYVDAGDKRVLTCSRYDASRKQFELLRSYWEVVETQTGLGEFLT